MTDRIHDHFLAHYQMIEIQHDMAHAFLDSKNVMRTDSQRQPYTLAQRIAKMVGDLPAEAAPVKDELVDPMPEPAGGWVANDYKGFSFSDA